MSSPPVRVKRLALSGCLLFLLSCSALFAQETGKYSGYIISHSGDTTFGTVIPGNSVYHRQRRVRFIDELGIRAHYDAELLTAYGYGDSLYVSRTRPFDYKKPFERDSVFMACSVFGAASLYRYFPPKSKVPLAGNVDFMEFLRMPNGQVYELMAPNFRKRLALAFLGQLSLTEMVRRATFSRKDMSRIVRRFNGLLAEEEIARRGN